MGGNNITWSEFIKKPRLTQKIDWDGIREVEHASEIVTLVKGFSNIIGEIRVNNVDFMGCSEDYVREKIMLLKRDLDWLTKRVKEVSKK